MALSQVMVCTKSQATHSIRGALDEIESWILNCLKLLLLSPSASSVTPSALIEILLATLSADGSLAAILKTLETLLSLSSFSELTLSDRAISLINRLSRFKTVSSFVCDSADILSSDVEAVKFCHSFSPLGNGVALGMSYV